jgi:hypothetical protein
MYHDHDDDGDVPVLHVIGRTSGATHLYYYRRWVNRDHWTHWEPVDVDIQGDHLVPVVFNRRLHLFWPLFNSVADPDAQIIPTGAQANAGLQDAKPTKHLEIQFAWSVYKNGKWTPKGVSADAWKMTDNAKPSDFSFRGFVDDSGTLILRCYRAGTKQGNAGFLGDFRSKGGDPAPVHVPAIGDPTPRLSPTGAVLEAIIFVASGDKLILFRTDMNSETDQFGNPIAVKVDIPVLKTTPSQFRLLPPHQDLEFDSTQPFFYQDDTRTFFVVPVIEAPMAALQNGDYVSPAHLGQDWTPMYGNLRKQAPSISVRPVKTAPIKRET